MTFGSQSLGLRLASQLGRDSSEVLILPERAVQYLYAVVTLRCDERCYSVKNHCVNRFARHLVFCCDVFLDAMFYSYDWLFESEVVE